MNKNMIPSPENLYIKPRINRDIIFSISLADIMPNYGLLVDDTQSVCIFAHAEMENKQTHEKESVQSAGESFGTSRWGTYSEFMCQLPAGGGCFPHFSTCGIDIEGVFYYDNTLVEEQKNKVYFLIPKKKLGLQNMMRENYISLLTEIGLYRIGKDLL